MSLVARRSIAVSVLQAVVVVIGTFGFATASCNCDDHTDSALDADTREQLHAQSRSVAHALLRLGRPESGMGTAFVISKEHRLIATAAHTADLLYRRGTLSAVLDGTTVTYDVAQVWYHPGIVRRVDDGLSLNVSDPAVGPVSNGPDVAVLRLADNGSPLPAEIAIASAEELHELVGKPIGVLGYYGMPRRPMPGPPVSSRYTAVMVQREVGFGMDPESLELGAFLVFAPSIGPGCSGGPAFLPNGNVVAIVGHKGRDPQTGAIIGGAARADALRQLIQYHGLTPLIRSEAGRPNIVPDWWRSLHESPEQVKTAERALSMMMQAENFHRRGDLRRAGEHCNEAIRLVPEYRGAYVERCRVFLHYLGCAGNDLSRDDRRRYLDWAYNDIRIAMSMIRALPSRYDQLFIQCFIYDLYENFSDSDYKYAVHEINLGLEAPDLTSGERAYYLNLRAQARLAARDWAGALRDYNHSIELHPGLPRWYANRAIYWQQRGCAALAAQDLRYADYLRRIREEWYLKLPNQSVPSQPAAR